MQKFILVLILAISSQSLATNKWVQIVGIDENAKSKNYDFFYESAAGFNSLCKSSNSKPECALFINPDPRLARGEFFKTGSITNNSGTPNLNDTKKYLSDLLANARRGDQIIISLQDHGAPVQGKSPSCIWINAKEYLCEDDLGAILKNKPAGVKVLVNADACFTGGFAELNSAEVCTTTQATRFEWGFIGGRTIWDSIDKRNPKNLSDLREPIFKESGEQKLLGSQVILQQLCAEARAKFLKSEVASSLSIQSNFTMSSRPSKFRDNDVSATKLSLFSKSALQTFSRNQTCEDLKLPSVVCSARKRLQSSAKDIQQLIIKLDVLSKREAEQKQWLSTEGIALYKKAPRSALNLPDLTLAELREFNESQASHSEPDWKKFDPIRAEPLKNYFNYLRPFTAKLRESEQTQQETDAILAKLKAKKYYDDLMIVQGCFYENAPQTPADIKSAEFFRKISQTFKERKFTEQDYEKAKNCESNFKF